MPPDNYGANVIIRFPVPRNSTGVVAELAPGAAGQEWEYSETEKKVAWAIKKFQGGSEQAIRIRISVGSSTPNIRKEIGPIRFIAYALS